MKLRRLGLARPPASALGVGCWSFSHSYGRAEESESIATIHRALELGCNFFDTADEYGAGQNEILVGKALAGRREQAILATKFGFVRGPDGKVSGRDGSPAHVHAACGASLRRLGTDYVDLYYLHRVDSAIPIEETVGAMAQLVEQGKVRHLGLSEASPEILRRAHAVHPIAALQSEYSLWTREPEREVIPLCRELGIAFVAFSPLGRGFFTGGLRDGNLPGEDFRCAMPRFQPDNMVKNLDRFSAIEGLAREKGCTPSQLALAWVLARGEHVFAIPGTRRIAHLEENIAALDVELSPGDLGRLDAAAPLGGFAGERYAADSLFKPEA
ncbi:MAG TPA: aldo/keto reductase [Candidatus Acidoferrales bacterium]|nr:aldo/keto reductase [Candidatus Acidoferrales bacterium]